MKQVKFDKITHAELVEYAGLLEAELMCVYKSLNEYKEAYWNAPHQTTLETFAGMKVYSLDESFGFVLPSSLIIDFENQQFGGKKRASGAKAETLSNITRKLLDAMIAVQAGGYRVYGKSD
jgi:hypothetical protein